MVPKASPAERFYAVAFHEFSVDEESVPLALPSLATHSIEELQRAESRTESSVCLRSRRFGLGGVRGQHELV